MTEITPDANRFVTKEDKYVNKHDLPSYSICASTG